jgi:hypothetical protein
VPTAAAVAAWSGVSFSSADALVAVAAAGSVAACVAASLAAGVALLAAAGVFGAEVAALVAPSVAVASGGGAHAARNPSASSRLPVIDAISFSAWRRLKRPSA